MTRESTILIVDDEASAQRTLRALLLNQGFNLAFAANGREALAQAAELDPDLILLDVMMPEMDGFEVCRHLRTHPSLAELPIIMVTALDDRESRLKAIEAGADDFVSKPFDRVELRARIRATIRFNRYRRLVQERTYRQEAEQEIERRNFELTLLNHILTVSGSTLSLQEILYVACEAFVRAFELPQATAVLLKADRPQFANVVEYQAPWLQLTDQDDGLAAETPLVGHLSSADLLIHKTPVALIEGDTEPNLPHIRSLMVESGVASLLITPVLIRDKIVGIIELRSKEHSKFSDQDLNLAQSIAAAIGQAMENANLYNELQDHAHHLEETVAQRTHELQIERDHTRAILEALAEAVVVTDMDGIIQYVNPAAGTLTGYDRQEMVGQSWHLWYSEQQAADFYTDIQDAFRARQMWRGEVVSRHKDGSTYDTSLTVAPLFDPNEPNGPISFVSVQRDITPLKEAERLKNQFISNASHELRTPLTTITLLSGNLDTAFDQLNNDTRRQMIKDIRKQAAVLNELISDVLEVSRLDSGRVSTERQSLNLAELVQEERKQLLPLAQEKSQRIQVAGIAQALVWGNKSQLRQVIRNVLNNAIKYTPQGGHITCECCLITGGEASELELPVSADFAPDRWAALYVTDTGIGISQDQFGHLFERFYRVQAQSNVPGTGLGLSIAQELVELHHGKILVTSAPNEGSVFTIYLPALEEST